MGSAEAILALQSLHRDSVMHSGLDGLYIPVDIVALNAVVGLRGLVMFAYFCDQVEQHVLAGTTV